MPSNLELRVTACEIENKKLRRSLRRQRFLWLGLLSIALVTLTVGADSQGVSKFDTVEAKHIVVRDSSDVIRARISGDLPDAVIDGKVIDRGEKAAGFMVYDTIGQERGGYVTFESGNVALTLDTRERQVALFVAGAEGGAAAEIWNKDGLVGLRADDLGARFTATRSGRVVYQNPEVEINEEVCSAYNNPEIKASREDRLSACMRRFKEDQCRACVGGSKN